MAVATRAINQFDMTTSAPVCLRPLLLPGRSRRGRLPPPPPPPRPSPPPENPRRQPPHPRAAVKCSCLVHSGGDDVRMAPTTLGVLNTDG